MKRILILNLLFFSFFCTFSQSNKYSRIIKWESPKKISHYYQINQKGINETAYLSFEGAQYNSHDSYLPYYYELLKVSSSNVKAEISNIKYQILSNEESKILRNKKEILEVIQYQSAINYIRKKPYLQLNMLPIRKNPNSGQLEKVISFDISIIGTSTRKALLNEKDFTSESVLKTGAWVKIRLNNNGVYKLTYGELTEMGFSNPSNIKVYGNFGGMLPVSNSEDNQDDLTQCSILMDKGSDGIFNEGDAILFYAEGPDKWDYDETNQFYFCTKHLYSDYSYFFLTTDGGSPNLVNAETTPSGTIDESQNSFTDYLHYEPETENLLESGQLWFGEHFDITTSYNFGFNFPNLANSESIKIRSAVAARSSANTSFDFRVGAQNLANLELGSVNLSSYTSTYATRGTINEAFTSSTDNINVTIEYNKSSSSSEGWLDYITLNATRQLIIEEDQLLFRYFNEEPTSKVVEFDIQGAGTSTTIWNITNPNTPTNVELSNGKIKVTVIPGENDFIAFTSDNSLTAEVIGNVENQNLHAINHRDMVIISHPEFISQANEIAEIHQQQDGLSVVVLTPEQIFNEFSSGAPDAGAMRNFVRMVYERATSSDTLKYLLLIGDGSYDHKSITAENINYILTYQSKNSLNPTSSFVTDDFFGLLDPTDNVESSNSGLVDIGIGRLPVRSATEAQQMVDKINSYLNYENKGDWLNSICFVGDDEDNNIHMRDADRLAEFVDTTYPHFFINKIYLDAYPQQSSAVYESYPEVNNLINDEVNNGILIFNYTGHGGENGLAHERVLTISDINSWVNFGKLTIFMTATCEFSRFDNHKYTSAGELALLNPRGGGIALFSTTRLVYSSPNYTLNRNFYNYVFEKDHNGNYRALGDIIRLAKNSSGTGNNKRNFTLLGDPAIKIPIPMYDVITDSINHNSVVSYTDTLKALTKVSFSGHIENSSGNLLSDYNGIINPLVLDKKRIISTLGNDGTDIMDFNVQNNILYKGKASVKNGRFNFSFVVPKDISYNFDYGKISYYSLNANLSAKGYFNDFIIGGSNDNAEDDTQGPGIELYMNDENFVNGGITDENPRLLAILTDSSGINTVGNGIGHDITAILDNNSNNIIVLNDYYESDIDDYQNGKIEYLFSELENGSHNLEIKVWDVYNNSTEGELEFIVAESESLAIKNLFNYPNPFTEQTAFYFDHNRPNEDLEVLIQIFTVSGKLVKTINTIINSNAFRSEPINWDGLDDFGDKIGRGVYIYQIKVRTFDGDTVKKIEKLVVLK